MRFIASIFSAWDLMYMVLALRVHLVVCPPPSLPNTLNCTRPDRPATGQTLELLRATHQSLHPALKLAKKTWPNRLLVFAHQPLYSFFHSQQSQLMLALPTVVSYQIESFSSKWELPSLLSPSFITQGRMGASKAALILMKNSHFDRTPQYMYYKIMPPFCTIRISHLKL